MATNDEDAPRPTPPRPPSSASVPRKPAANPASSAGNPPSAPRVPRPASQAGDTPSSVKRVARPASGVQSAQAAKAAARAKHDEEHEERRRQIVASKEGLDPITKYGMIGAGALAIVVVIAVFIIKAKKDDQKARLEAYEAKVAEVYKKLSDLDVSKEGDAIQAIELAESTRKIWVDHEKGRDIEMQLARAKGKVEASKEQRETVTRFTDIEKKLTDVSNMTPEAVKDLRRQLEELEVKLTTIGPEMLARYQLARASADRAYATRLLEDAKTFAAANSEGGAGRLALQRFQTVEDELKALVDRAYNDKNKELTDFYSPLYKEAIENSDRLIAALFTPAEIEKLPVIDCLSGAKATEWNASQAKGFSHRVDKGTLQLVGPDADAGKYGVISIGDREQWRHLIIDMEFTIDAGNIDLYLRLGKNPNINTPQYQLKTTGDLGMRAGRPYRARVSMIGSKFIVKFADDQADAPSGADEDLTWVRSRKGAVGLQVPPGAKLKFTKFQVRELR